MRLALLGVRGSTPAPGQAFVRYGGHTSCVAVLAEGAAAPNLILDAGTGLRDLGRLLPGQPFRGAILLSHLHWDHLHGLPFAPPVDRPDARVDLHLPAAADGPSPVDLITRAMSPPVFPISPAGLGGTWRFHRSLPGAETIEGFTVWQAEIAHKGGLTYGIRIESGGASVAYLPDHAPRFGFDNAVRLARDADVLLHDGQFLDGERVTADAFGHATVDDAVEFARRCGVRRLVLTHHAPGRTDDELDALAKELAEARLDLPVELARQGDVLTVGRG